MKALKYGIALCIGLLAGAPVLAQSSGQSGEINPKSNNLQDFEETREHINGSPIPQGLLDAQKFDRDMHFPDDVRLALEQGHYAEAVAKMDAFVKKTKEDPCKVALMCCNLYAGIRWTEPKYKADMMAALALAETKCTKSSDLYIWKIRIFGDEQPDSVMTWLNKAIEVEPYPDIYYRRGEVYLQMGEVKKACADYKQAFDGGYMSAQDRIFSMCGEGAPEGNAPNMTPPTEAPKAPKTETPAAE